MQFTLFTRNFTVFSPSWYYPLYTSLQQRWPLPLCFPDQQLEEDTSDDEREQVSGDESEEEEITFLPTQATDAQASSRSSKSAARSCGITRTKLKKSTPAGTEDSDQEPDRRPLADSIHTNRKQQRLNQHPMAGGKGKQQRAAAQATRASTRNSERANQERDEAQKENEELKQQLRALTKRLKLERGGKSKVRNTTQKAMVNVVDKCTKQKLWKVCKFFKNDSKLVKGARFVMSELDLAELEGLEGADLIDAQETWMATYKDDVRIALNRQRNYVQQELRDIMIKAFKENKENEFPNVEQMRLLVVRDKLCTETPDEERKKFEALFDNYWTVLIPKVAGHHAWGPNKRHYCLMSYGGEEVVDPSDFRPYVTASDEAFLLTLWENCYPKWWYKECCRRQKKAINEADPLMKTPFTNPKGGQKQFGGWLPAGLAHYNNLLKEIKTNRTDQKPYVQAVEQAALERIQAANLIGEEDNSKKKAKGKRKAEEVEEDDEETEDENDFTTWE